MNLTNNIIGTLTVIDSDTQEIVHSSTNDFHLENLSKSIVMALGRMDAGFIEEIHFGDGGTITSPTNALMYKAPRIVGPSCSLYNKTYSKVINNRSPNFIGDSSKNYIKYETVAGSNTTRLVIYCTLGYAEPSNKFTAIDDILPTDVYRFDEVSLNGVDSITGERILFSHWISKPIEKKLSRAMEFMYTIDFTTKQI